VVVVGKREGMGRLFRKLDRNRKARSKAQRDKPAQQTQGHHSLHGGTVKHTKASRRHPSD